MKKIGIIGCGNMGEAILKGIVSEKLFSHKRISVSDADSTKLDRIKKVYNVNATFNNSLVAKTCNIIIIAVKPQDMGELLAGISEYLNDKKLLVSIAAGITTKKINEFIGRDIPVARAMPNMPALINMGFSALSFSKSVDKGLAKSVVSIFGCIGDVVEVDEKDLDTITAISGSGPAYFFYLIEMLIKSGVKLGLKKEVAERAAIKTALGSAELLSKFGEDAGRLRKKVTSEGGTTEAAFKAFKKSKLGPAIQKGIKAARDRSKELSGG
ncbi:MAG: pyrroline-5-carboxylate reductase [Candidatus Omnitrophica bacterium]|nr:pyrroline-5-carboxylate reductase [Candidatus Omnitrophota bacterium]